MPGIWDAIQSFLGMQPQQQPAGQATQQAPYQPPSGTLLEALGVPLALFGAYEAARGRPIGAPAGLAGAGLSYLGNQRNQNATAYSAFEAALQAAQKRAPAGAGVQEQLKALEPLGEADPTEGINETKDVLKQYFEGQKKNRTSVPPELNAASIIANHGLPIDQLTSDDQRQKAYELYKSMKGLGKGGGTPEFLKHPLAATLYRMGVTDPDKATPQQVNDATKLQQAEDSQKFEQHARIAAKYGLTETVDPNTGAKTWGSRLSAPGRPASVAPIQKIPGYIGAHSTDIPGASIYRPAPTTGLKATVGAKAAKLLGGGKSFMLLPNGTKVFDGDIIPGTGIRWIDK